MIKTKFNVASITYYGNAGGMQVILYPVMNNSPENEEFWKKTPSGEIELYIDNPDIKFEFGEYYVDFTKA